MKKKKTKGMYIPNQERNHNRLFSSEIETFERLREERERRWKSALKNK
jgi:hypothetical protein